ncbi:MAG: M23 family metallopeptidase [Clostridiales bacterium]|nr:M23 family metallopeptidase [Clostridiales bacterium]
MKDKIKNFFKNNGYAAAVYSCVALVVVLAAGVALYDSITEKNQGYGEEAVNNSRDRSYREETTELTTVPKTAEAETEPTTAARIAERASEAATGKAAEGETKTDKKTGEADRSSEIETRKSASADNLFSFDENTQVMLMPVEGQIVMDYSPEIAVFDATLEQYRTNDTICIAAEDGAPVAAAADGVVVESGYDEINGNSIVIDHGNGWMSTYSQLGENIPVAVGDIVNAGEIIAQIGEPTDFQSALGSHLEFYLTHNNESADPKLLFEGGE